MQGATTLVPTDHPKAEFYILRPPVSAPGKSLTELEWSMEFRIRYNDIAGYREFADKWSFGIKEGKPFMLRINATELQRTPAPSEDYVAKQGPQ
jgi:hypothetical protein